MKLGIITDEVTQDIKAAVAFAKKHQLQGVELRSVDDMNIDEMSIAQIKEMKNIIDSEGLEVCAISSSFFKCSIDDKKEIEENIEKLKRLIERAYLLECSNIRGFAFFQSGSLEERFEEIIQYFEKPIEIIEKESIKILLESDPSVFTTNCEKLSKVIKAINHPSIRAIYDPGNDIYDPDQEKPYPNGFDKIKQYIEHVHIKDAKIINGKPESVKVGTGDVPFKEIFRSLQDDIDYNGYIVLETHYRPHAEIPEELMQKPKGTLFSLNGDIASEESMIELKKIITPYL